MTMDGPKAPSAFHGPSGITYHPNEKANVTADYLENQFTSHVLCDENHERRDETRVQALLASAGDTANTLKLRKACRLDGISNECLRHFPKEHWYV
jgi:hypothetical protein